MRKDEQGNNVPSTLGEYRDLCAAIGGTRCPAILFLDEKIEKAQRGREELVIAPDSQMRALLMPMLIRKDGGQKKP